MTESIYSFKKDIFPFDNLSLANPHGLQGGAYFSKLKLLGNKISLQTPKSKTKNGIIKTDKKIYCDLLFDKDDDNIIEFISELEDKIKNLIYEKKEKWFHTDMDMDTIEYHWQNVLRPYKGQYYLLRCFIKKPKNTLNTSPSIQIYDEEEQLLDLDDVTKNKTIVSLLDLTGLKFTSQSFSLEFNLTQVMVLKDSIVNNKCLIKKDSLENTNTLEKPIKLEDKINKITHSENLKEDNLVESLANTDDITPIETDETKNENINELDKLSSIIDNSSNRVSLDTSKNDEDKNDEDKNDDKIIEKNTNDDINTLELNEINLEIPEELESVQLKNPNEVYLEIYKEVKKRAKEAKKKAIEAYLEAKRIKSLYLLDEIESSDDENELLAITED